MTSISSRTYQPYLLQHYRLTQWSHQLLATTLAALLMAISANISIPLHPVPLSLQSLAVLLLGAFLGRKLAVLAILEYLLLGACGLPFFAGGYGGINVLVSASAGYLYGFIFSAYIAGWAAERGYDRHFFSGLCAFALAHQIIFVFGVFYLAFYLHTSIHHALQLGYLPFAGFDLLKFFIATAIMFTLWQFGKKPS
ncbi:biotin transporter BioY [Snodgrassella sp. ESL0304]|uniref:biotin transporter BioY n=1 Tax=Snodgrassella sp. ESL0304 TaxID=2705032 RepID=UPI001583EB83|nr:biotin transporter BioY [Snodgrassella sp. ESL0304]NUE80405.1 biotin transporter BioY [Snodgrassella sp. ESL0304]